VAAVNVPTLNALRPSLESLDQLVEPLTPGELHVAQALARLDAGWTVYVKPRIGLDQPDFLAISDTFGVCVIEVVDWSPDTARQNEVDEIEVCDAQGKWSRVVEPRAEASRSRSLVFDQFYAFPEHGGSPTDAVRGVVLTPNLSTIDAKTLLPVLPPDEPQSVIGVFGRDSIDESIRDIVVGLGCPIPPAPSISKLRQHVVASERLRRDGDGLPWMSESVIELADNPTGQKMRRYRGSAGSGKSFGLTARAARLAAEGKSVLMLTLNVTLSNRLRAMATQRCAESGANATLIASSNFHTFCTRIVQDAEMSGLELHSPRGVPWTLGIVAKTEQAFEQGFDARYDAVLIDEGQDFTFEWWNLLRQWVVSPDGEMLIVADPTQDIYERFEWMTSPELVESGFPEEWTDLDASYRLPHDLLDLSNDFAGEYLEGEQLLGVRPDESVDIPGGDPGLVRSVRSWFDIERLNQLGRAVGHEVVRLLRECPTLTPADVAFVCDYHHDGVAAVRVIEAAGYPVHHVFSRNPDAPRRRRKHRFWPGDEAVKGCTAHSLKGWESPAIVMGIGVDDRAQDLAYVAMTRVASRTDGGPAFVSVINADKRLREFGQRFVAGSATAPTEPITRLVPEPSAAPPPGFAAPLLDVPSISPISDSSHAPAAAMMAPPKAPDTGSFAAPKIPVATISPSPSMEPPSMAAPTIPEPQVTAPPAMAAPVAPGPALAAPMMAPPAAAAPTMTSPAMAAPAMAAPAMDAPAMATPVAPAPALAELVMAPPAAAAPAMTAPSMAAPAMTSPAMAPPAAAAPEMAAPSMVSPVMAVSADRAPATASTGWDHPTVAPPTMSAPVIMETPPAPMASPTAVFAAPTPAAPAEATAAMPAPDPVVSIH